MRYATHRMQMFGEGIFGRRVHRRDSDELNHIPETQNGEGTKGPSTTTPRHIPKGKEGKGTKKPHARRPRHIPERHEGEETRRPRTRRSRHIPKTQESKGTKRPTARKPHHPQPGRQTQQRGKHPNRAVKERNKPRLKKWQPGFCEICQKRIVVVVDIRGSNSGNSYTSVMDQGNPNSFLLLQALQAPIQNGWLLEVVRVFFDKLLSVRSPLPSTLSQFNPGPCLHYLSALQ